MTQYLLSVYPGEPPAPEAMEQIFEEVDALNDELQREDVEVFGGGLEPADTAMVVRVRDADVVTTDGPFTETKEHVGGFWILDVPDLGAALNWAAKATRACQAPVEVRPFQNEPEA